MHGSCYLAFDQNRPEPAVSPLSQALAVAENSPVLVKYVALLLGVLVVMAFGVRPALRRASVASKRATNGTAKELGAAAQKPALSPPEPPPVDPERTRAQEILEQVSGHLKREPAQSSRLLQSWIHSD